jgi:pimeloyl-ACP methyl ester carboxylesterase
MIALTRRNLLQAGICTLAASSGLLRSTQTVAVDRERAAITPFTFTAPQRVLDDLRLRLQHARLPERETVPDWSQGVPLEKIRGLIQYWRTGYDWRRCEVSLSHFPQFRIEIDGLYIHFLHVRSSQPDALPLIMTHGWPGSVLEFLKIIDPLTNPTAHGGRTEDAFHVVAPSLPGFAFSDKPTERGWNVDRIARAWSVLMQRLGYSRYVAQGGDWGAWITTRMAQHRFPGLLGIHLNFPLVYPQTLPANLTHAEQHAVESMNRFQNKEFGFFLVQAAKPQMTGYALADSPVGQFAWIYEQFYEHTDNDGDPESALTRDEMLDDITLYWLTNTGASSARMYFENADLGANAGMVDLPVGYSIFPRELYCPPRSWAEACYPKLFYWHELDRGGHFAAFERPTLFTNELRACFRLLRT